MVRVIHHRQLNTAGLEADVMRFMAIIAFCLIAMMALVKDVEPAAATVPNLATPALPGITEVIEEQPKIEPMPISTLIPIPAPKPQPVASGLNSPAPSIARVQSTPSVVDEPATEKPRRQDLDAEPESLTFRFDSDRTFLHLIATERLQLYASTKKGFLAMDERFNIAESTPSGELFEVMAQSIPVKITAIFKRINVSPVYLVALPVETRRDLNNFLETRRANTTSGVLIIHRDGHISHEI